MFKLTLTGVVCVAIGVAAGALAARQRFAPALDETMQATLAELEAARADLAEYKEEAETELSKLDLLERDYAAREMEIGRLEAQIESSAALAEDVFEMPDLEALFAGMEFEEEEKEKNPKTAKKQERTPEERAKMEAKVAEYFARVREGKNNFYAERVARTKNPEAAERLSAMAEWTDYVLELQGQLKTSEPGEEREALMLALQDARTQEQTLIREQQLYELNELAARNGITDPAQRQRVAEDILRTTQGPFFAGRGGKPVAAVRPAAAPNKINLSAAAR